MKLTKFTRSPTSWIGYGFAFCLMGPANILASIPHVASVQSYTIKLASLSEQARSPATTATLSDFRVKRSNVADFEFADAVLALMLQRIGVNSDREKTVGLLNTATPGQKALFAVHLMRMTVAELGFIGYLESTAGDLIPEVERGLRLIGAKEYLKLFKRSLSIFKKDKGLITSSRNRKEVLENLSNEKKYSIYDPMDDKFEQLEDNLVLQTYIIEYVNANPRLFFVK